LLAAKEKISRNAAVIGTKLYGVINADPPWRLEPVPRTITTRP
jgi:hypothetical protein